MGKKYLSILFVFLAYSVVLLHNCVPHHHHEAAEDHYQQTDHGHNTGHTDHNGDDDDHGLLNHAFGHFKHDQGAEMTKMSIEKIDIDKHLDLVKSFIPFISAFILKIEGEQEATFLPPGHTIILYSHLSSPAELRRGPPAFIA